MITRIEKTSGEVEEFSPEKIKESLMSAGADTALAEKLTREISSHPEDFPTTDSIHQRLFSELQQINERPVAARYNLRRAIISLGPSGYPFEKFTAALLEARGFHTQLNQTLTGSCVNHEVDVIATEPKDLGGTTYLIENKFHKRPGYKVSVRIPLYVKARVDDIVENAQSLAAANIVDLNSHGPASGGGSAAWIFTNTKFSKDAIRYGKCKGMQLTGWSYPKGDSLSYWIDKLGIHPITAMTSLNDKQKTYLIEKGVVLCRQLQERKHLLQELGLKASAVEASLAEAKGICGTD